MNGESGADVYDRATAFWESVFRSMDHSTGTQFQNYVIVTHGLMMVRECGADPRYRLSRQPFLARGFADTRVCVGIYPRSCTDFPLMAVSAPAASLSHPSGA